MRTKTLLLTAALTAASTLASLAQVYSVNIVGYINLNIPVGYSMIANQLNASPDNLVTTLFPTAPDQTTIYKFNGTSYDSMNFVEGLGWDDGGTGLLTTMALSPGQGAFILAPTAFTATFVGEVQLVSDTALTAGYQIVSSAIPQAGGLDADLLYPPTDQDTVYKYDNATKGYKSWNYVDGLGWDDGAGNIAPPPIAVGESFFLLTTAPKTWHRAFSVGP